MHVSQWRPPLKPNYFVLKTSDSGGTFKVPQSSIFTYLILLGNDQDIIKKKLLLEILQKLHLSSNSRESNFEI